MTLRLLFCIICLLTCPAFGQTYNSGHCPQPNDEIARHAISMSDAGPSGRNAIWSLADMRVDSRKTVLAFSQSDDTIPCTVSSECAHVTHLQPFPDGLYERNVENHLQKTAYDSLPLAIPSTLRYGDIHSGTISGNGVYCDRMDTKCHGTWRIECDGNGTLVTPDGDSIRNVLRLHSTRNVTTTFYPRNGAEQASTPHGATRVVSTSSTIAETYTWYSSEYRYPILELRLLRPSGSSSCAHTAYYTPTDVLEKHRTTDGLAGYEPQPDGNRTDGATADGSDFNYCMSNDTGSHRLAISYSSERQYDVKAVLADIRGIVYRTASHVGCTEGTLTLYYGGLPRGQYIVYINNGMNVYAEKFNNK